MEAFILVREDLAHRTCLKGGLDIAVVCRLNNGLHYKPWKLAKEHLEGTEVANLLILR